MIDLDGFYDMMQMQGLTVNLHLVGGAYQASVRSLKDPTSFNFEVGETPEQALEAVALNYGLIEMLTFEEALDDLIDTMKRRSE